MVRAFGDRFFQSLQYKDFRRLWSANASAQAAVWALIVARGWLIFDTTESSFWVGAATFAAMGPQFIVPPIIGVLADRLERRTILLWTYSINLAQALALFALALAGGLEVWSLVLLSLVNGIGRSAQMPTSQALAASLVPRESLLNALSLNASTQHGSRLIGPGVVTPLLAVAGAAPAFLACSLFYAYGLICILSIERRDGDRRVSKESFFTTFTAGLKYVYTRPVLRFIILVAIFHCSLTMAFESLLPAFSHERLTDSSSGFGALIMGVGAGALVSTVLISGIRTSKGRGNVLLLMGLFSGLGQVALSATSVLWLAVLAAALMGGAQAAFMTMVQATTQSIAADEFRGRLASINSFSLGGSMAVMNLINGSVADQLGADHLMFWQGLIFVVIVLISMFAVTGKYVYGRTSALELEPQTA